MTVAQWPDVMDTNLNGPMRVVRALLPGMADPGCGRVVLVSSTTGPQVGNPGLVHHAASKAGLEGAMRGFALEVASTCVTINAIRPSSILTDGVLAASDDDDLEFMAKGIPMRRPGDVKEIAELAHFVALAATSPDRRLSWMAGRPCGSTRKAWSNETTVINQQRRQRQMAHHAKAWLLSGLLAATAITPVAALSETTLRVGFDSANSSFDPIATTENTDIRLITSMNVYLVRLSTDGSSLVPDLADSWSVSDDGTVYTFELGDGAFSNGDPVTAADVVFSLERVRDHPGSVQAPLYSLITDISAVDGDTVAVTLSAASPATLSAIAMYPAAILPEGLGGLSEEDFGASPISAGPYFLEEWERGGQVVLAKNTFHPEADTVAIDRIEWTPIPDDNSRLLQLQGGELDIALPIPLNLVSEVDAAEGIEVQVSPSTLTYNINFNYENELFQDIKVREAVGIALDVEGITSAITYGLGGRSNSVLAEGTLYYDASIPLRDYEPDRASAILAEAGAAGTQVELMIPIGNSLLEQFSVIAQQQLNAAGLNVSVRRVEETQYWGDFEAGNYQMAIGSWTNDMAHPDQKMSFILGNGDANNYFTRYRNDELAAQVNAARAIADDAAAQEAYSALQRAAFDEVFWIDLFKLPYTAAVSDRVEGFSQDVTGRIEFERLSLN